MEIFLVFVWTPSSREKTLMSTYSQELIFGLIYYIQPTENTLSMVKFDSAQVVYLIYNGINKTKSL